jgi:hypothetical protein
MTITVSGRFPGRFGPFRAVSGRLHRRELSRRRLDEPSVSIRRTPRPCASNSWVEPESVLRVGGMHRVAEGLIDRHGTDAIARIHRFGVLRLPGSRRTVPVLQRFTTASTLRVSDTLVADGATATAVADHTHVGDACIRAQLARWMLSQAVEIPQRTPPAERPRGCGPVTRPFFARLCPLLCPLHASSFAERPGETADRTGVDGFRARANRERGAPPRPRTPAPAGRGATPEPGRRAPTRPTPPLPQRPPSPPP